jgi:hypothetical protein
VDAQEWARNDFYINYYKNHIVTTFCIFCKKLFVARGARPRELFTELAFYFYKTLHFVLIKIILLCYFVGFVQALCGALRAPP